MDVKQEPFDRNTEIIKMEPDLVTQQIDENYCCSTKDDTFKNDRCDLGDTDNICEYKTPRESVNFNGIKQECELPKIECSDFLQNIEYESVSDNVNNVPNFIKQEPENVNEVKAADIKPVVSEISQYVQFKEENIENELLTSHCDLPTLKSEAEDTDHPDYFAQPCSSKQTVVKLKPSNTVRNVHKQKKKGYPWSVLQKIFRSPRKNLFNDRFGRCCETCYYCGQFFITKSQFLYHFVVVHFVKKITKVCKRKFGQHTDCQCIIHIVQNSFKCEICSKRFKLQRNLKRHLKIHTVEKPVTCEICLKQFNRKSGLKNHLKTHSGEQPFDCEICWKRFTFKRNLKLHLKIHNGEKPFECEICSKRFTQKNNLNDHLKIHTGEKRFKCEKCSKHFTQKNCLNTHLKIHTGEKSFNCEICSKRFIKKWNLDDHLKIHTGEKPYKCEQCSKHFTQKSGLRNHLKIHNGEKPFECEICLKRFTQKIHLNDHQKIHTGEKPFGCEICSKRFRLGGNLKRHLKIHTGDNPFKLEV